MRQIDQDLVETFKVPRITSVAVQPLQAATRTLRQRAVRFAPLALLLVLAFGLMSINLRQPWVSVHEDNGLVFMSAALNNIRFGVGYTKGETVVDTETLNASSPLGIPGVPASQEFSYLLTGPVHPTIYPNHPPLLGLTVTASLLLFGQHFWAVRLVPIAFSLGSIVLFYFLARSLFDEGVASFSTFLLATFPMMAYFGRDVAFEAEVLFWLLVLLTGYVHWERTSKRRWLALVGASVVLGTLYDWPMVFFAVILFAVDAVSKRRINAALALATVVPAFATCGLTFAQDYWALNGTLAPLVHILQIRSGDTGYGGRRVSIFGWLKNIMQWNIEGFGTWGLVALPLAAEFVIVRARQEGASLRMRLIVVMFLCGLSNVLAFREGAFIHAYWQQYFLPVYALTIGWAGVELVRRVVRDERVGWRWRWVPLATAAACILVASLPTIVTLYSSRSGVFVPLL